jgi:hypothetical protein
MGQCIPRRPHPPNAIALLEEDIIRFVDDIRDTLRQMLFKKPEPDIALGDTNAVRPPIRFLQAGLHHLLEAGRVLEDSSYRAAYFRHLLLVIMAAYHLGGYTRVTRTVETVVRRQTQQKGAKAAQAKASPERQRRHDAIKEIWPHARYKTAAHVHRQLTTKGFKVTEKTVRQDLRELGLASPQTHHPKERS